MLPDLCLKPHEISDLPAGEPLCAPAEQRVRVESGAYAGDYLLRFIATQLSIKPLVARRETPGAPLLYVHQNATLGTGAARHIEMGMFNRLLYFDARHRLARAPDDWTYNLAMFRGERGDVHWSCRYGDPLSEVNLRCFDETTQTTRWRCPLNWKFDTPDEQIECDIQRMSRDETSYFALACGWNFSSEDQQGRRLLKFANGDWDELMRRLRDLILSFNDRDPNAEWRLTVRVPRRENFASDAEFFAMLQSDTRLITGGKYHQFSEIQARIFEAIMRDFEPTWNGELHDLLVRHEIRGGDELNFPIRVTVAAASAHECLEARLNLRDWLRDKVTPDELAEWMGAS